MEDIVMKEIKITITDEDSNVLASFSTLDTQNDFNSDELCIKEGLKLSLADALESVVDDVKNYCTRLLD